MHKFPFLFIHCWILIVPLPIEVGNVIFVLLKFQNKIDRDIILFNIIHITMKLTWLLTPIYTHRYINLEWSSELNVLWGRGAIWVCEIVCHVLKSARDKG